MTEQNLYKLNLYNLLYTHPVCEYMREMEDGSKEVNILFIGDKEKAIETYKAMYWVSQYPDCLVRMVVVNSQEELLSIQNELEDKNQYPAFEDFRGKGYLDAPIYHACDYKNHDVRISAAINKKKAIECASSLNKLPYLFQYIIIATDDVHIDDYLTDAMVKVASGQEADNKRLCIAIYNSIYKKGLDANEDLDHSQYVLPQNVTITQFLKAENQCYKAELYRVASNINLAYTLQYNQRASVKDVNEEFRKMCDMEFNDLMDSYNADSSYASAVHIPYKIYYCLGGQKMSQEKALELFSQTIRERGSVFNKLIATEHRRWNAYMATRGYRYPGQDEWNKMFVNSKKPQINVDEKLHACMCECSDSGPREDMKERKFWKNSHNDLAPLDYVSWRLFKEADKRTKKLNKDFEERHGILHSVAMEELKLAIQGLFRDELDSIWTYRNAWNKACLDVKNVVCDEQKMLLQELEQIDWELQTVIYRNQRVNFFESDVTLLRLLPFCLWYGNQYSTVMVFSNGKAAEDIIIPTLLYAKEVLTVGSESALSDSYQNNVDQYYKNRGNNTKALYLTALDMKTIEDKMKDKVLILTGNQNWLREFRAQYTGKTLSLGYDSATEIITGDTNIFSDLGRQSITVKEFMNLIGGDVLGSEDPVIPNNIQQEVRHFFWNNAVLDGNAVRWVRCIDFLIQTRDRQYDRKIRMSSSNKSVIFVFDKTLDVDSYNRNGLSWLLRRLEEMRLITNLKIQRMPDEVYVQFLTYQREICDAFLEYTEKDKDFSKITARMEFYPFGRSSKNMELDGLCRESVVYSADILKEKLNSSNIQNQNLARRILENPRLATFYRNMKKIGLCSSVETDGDTLKRVVINDRKYASLFTKSGNLFEELVGRAFQDSGMFDDVRVGVTLLWDSRTASYNKEYLLKQYLDRDLDKQILPLVDYKTFLTKRDEVGKMESPITSHDNEIDVIATRGMQTYFISCKCIRNINTEILAEIMGEADLAGAKGMLAVALPAKDYDLANLKTAAGKKVPEWQRRQFRELPILDQEILKNPDIFKETMEQIVSGVYQDTYL